MGSATLVPPNRAMGAVMGEGQRQALARLLSEDGAFKAALSAATSIDDAVRIAREHGVEASAEDFAQPRGAAFDLSDAEIEAAGSGGQLDRIWPTAPWVAC